MIEIGTNWDKLFSKCTLTLDFRRCLLEEGVLCVISFQVKDASIVLFDCVMPIRSFPTLFTCSKPNSELLLDIWVRCLAGQCQQHKQYPRVYSWYGHIRQTTATWRVLLGLTACIMSSQFLHVVHRFCIFWCIHQMYSATIAQSSPKYGRPYYLFGSLFLIPCFLVSLGCSAHAYALTMRLYNLVITLF